MSRAFLAWHRRFECDGAEVMRHGFIHSPELGEDQTDVEMVLRHAIVQRSSRVHRIPPPGTAPTPGPARSWGGAREGKGEKASLRSAILGLTPQASAMTPLRGLKATFPDSL